MFYCTFHSRSWNVVAILFGLAFLTTLTKGYNQERQSQNLLYEVFQGPVNVSQKLSAFKDSVVIKNEYITRYVGPAYRKKRKTGNMDNPPIRQTTTELIRNAGFKVTRHEIMTNDSYFLTLFRIKSTRYALDKKKFPILFQHGLMGTSDDFLLLDAENCFPFQFARRGHDVWLSNSRGNEYSKRHAYLSTNSAEYWNFSWHEMAAYDLPAVLDFIRKRSSPVELENGNVTQGIYYVGHGLGTTILYASMSLYPDTYGRQVLGAANLGPMAFLSQSRSPLTKLRPLIKHYQTFPKDGPVSFTVIKDFLYGTHPELCAIQVHGRSLCGPAIFTPLADNSRGRIRDETFDRILAHIPSTTSMKNLIHFLQLLDAEFFRQFDYGFVKNFLIYNQTTPLKYNVFRITIGSDNIFGESDILIEQKDAEKIVVDVGDQFFKTSYLFRGHNYGDFLFSEAFVQAVYGQILASIDMFNKYVHEK